MGFSSLDDLISEITSGKFNRQDWQKSTGANGFAVGRWYDFGAAAGFPVANAFAGTALAWRTCDEATGNGTQIYGMPHGGLVTPDTKHVLNTMALSAVATAVPGVLMFVDLQGYWPGIQTNTVAVQALTGIPALRYANGAGCRLYTVCTTGTGASAQNIALSYTDQGGVAGNTLPITVAMTASAVPTHIHHSGTAANNYGPFLPLASGDSGVQNVASVTMSGANTPGTFALCLARPLFQIPISIAGVAAERDLVNQLPSLPRVMDGACVVPLFFAGAATAANTPIMGAVELGWG